MTQMGTWLDNQAIEPVVFEIAFLPGRDTRFRVQFRKRGDAVMFAASFGRQLRWRGVGCR